jgi:hypothetical protein
MVRTPTFPRWGTVVTVAQGARAVLAVGLTAALWLATGLPAPVLSAQTDLDEFMRRVIARRDDNWAKLQQYVLDERQEVDIRGPGRAPLWGERREFTWYIRDGFFVRSPTRVNGVTIGEDERRKYEARFLRREQERDKRERERAEPVDDPSVDVEPAPDPAVPGDFGGLARQAQPRFISSAYFLRFKFDEGRYAFVGREPFDGREVLRVEYYPTMLFTDNDDDRRRQRRREERDAAAQAQARELTNKGSRVTLWIEPTAHQIVRYTFDNVDLDFFPAQWLASVQGLHASMTMGQPFPDVWLPEHLELRGEAMLAVGLIEFRQTVEYRDYRRADVTSVIRVPAER